MNRDDIIKLAREANGDDAWDGGVEWVWAEVERFAALVIAQEREACAALCDKISDEDGFEGGYADYCAHAIRARGQG